MDDLLVIMGYGFSLPGNTSDHYSLGFSPAIATYIKAAKARRSARTPSQSALEFDNSQPEAFGGSVRGGSQVLESSKDFNVEEILEQNIHWVRLVENESYEFSPQFLEFLSVAVENPREAHVEDNCSAYKTDFSTRQFSRNKLHVICAVIMILQKGQKAIQENDKDLPRAPQNSKHVDAARYRHGHLSILDGVLDCMYMFLKSVTTPETNGPRVVRLEDILTNSPKSLLKDLRGVLNAGIRTRDPMKIRERGGVDFAFTAWLCGLWVYAQSGTKGEDEINLTYFRWLQFFQQNYAEPSEDSISDERPGDPLLEERAEWFDPIRSASGVAGLEVSFIARSYLDAVQAATEKRPHSVYSDGRVTVRRLEWCLNIIRNEGVWCPSLDEGKREEDDEWVLFLEL